MMRGVVRSGTARRAFVEGHDRAGKTGTTNDFLDAWFVGFTAEHTIAVWIGTDSVSTLGDKETGGKSALPAWLTIVQALGEEEGAFRAAPPGAIWTAWQGQWVALERGRASGPKDRGAPPGPLPTFGGRGFIAPPPAVAPGG
jgi:penicillin-binding protein 1A